VVANTVKRLETEVQRSERDVRPPRGVIEPALDERIQGFFAGVTARSMSAVMTEGDGFGEVDVQTEGPSDASGDLGNFEGMSKAGAQMVVGKNENLRFPR
jgi:hypothetical protein